MLGSKEQNPRQISVARGNGTNGKHPLNRGKVPDQSIIHLLHRASQRASEIFATETRGYDLTARQYAVISTISKHEGLSQTDLVRLTGIDRSTLADVVQRLLRRGIIERKRTPRDGRTYSVSLSEAGRTVLQSIRSCANRADRSVRSLLEQNDPQVMDALEKLIGEADHNGSKPLKNGNGTE